MKLIVAKETGEKVVSEKLNPVRRQLGIIALEQNQNGTRFTVDVLQVSHLRYSYDPDTQILEVQFVTEKKERKVGEDENHKPRF